MIADRYLIQDGSDPSLQDWIDYRVFADQFSVDDMDVGITVITLYKDSDGLHLK